MTIAHDLKCGACSAPATHEQCGGVLVCDEHTMPEGRAWLIDAKTVELHGCATCGRTGVYADRFAVVDCDACDRAERTKQIGGAR